MLALTDFVSGESAGAPGRGTNTGDGWHSSSGDFLSGELVILIGWEWGTSLAGIDVREGFFAGGLFVHLIVDSEDVVHVGQDGVCKGVLAAWTWHCAVIVADKNPTLASQSCYSGEPAWRSR